MNSIHDASSTNDGTELEPVSTLESETTPGSHKSEATLRWDDIPFVNGPWSGAQPQAGVSDPAAVTEPPKAESGRLRWDELPWVKRQNARAGQNVVGIENDRFDQQSATDGMLEVGGTAVDTPYGLMALRSEAAEVASSPVGTRNHALNVAWFRMGQVIAGGSLTVQTARAALVEAGRSAGLDQVEVDLVLRTDDTSGVANGAAHPRVPSPLPELPQLTTLASPALRSALEVDDPAKLRAALDDQFIGRDGLDHLPVPEPLIDTVLPRHAYGILRGRDQSFKSFVALDWALCLATGRPWQGHRCERVRVLYIAGEGANGLSARVDAWEAEHLTRVPDDAVTVRKSAMNMFKPNAPFPHLLERIRDGEYGLVIVDTLRRVSGPADGNGSDMGAVVDNLDRIKRATCNGTVLAIAHTDKGDNDTRGYSGIEDDADVVWEAKRDDALLVLNNTKQKDGPEHGSIHLRSRPVLHSLVLESTEATVATTTESQIKILDAMRRSFRDGTFGTALKEASGLSKSTYYDALADLLNAGHLVKSGTAQRPFYTLPDDGADQ